MRVQASFDRSASDMSDVATRAHPAIRRGRGSFACRARSLSGVSPFSAL